MIKIVKNIKKIQKSLPGTINNRTGFTFIELILYISILTIILSAFVPFAWNAIQTGVKSAVQQEIDGNARYISERIKYEIRNASDINTASSVFGSSPGTLSLAETVSAINPTVIALSAGNITIKQGLADVVNLNSVNTVVSSLIFTDYSSADNKTKNIQYSMTISAKFGGTSQEYQGSIVVQGSAEVRSN